MSEPLGYPFYLRCKECGGVAFYLKRKPTVGELANTDDAMLPSGEHPRLFSKIACGTCGAIIGYLDPLEVFPCKSH